MCVPFQVHVLFQVPSAARWGDSERAALALPLVQIMAHCTIAAGSWASYLRSLCLSLLICVKAGVEPRRVVTKV